MYYIPTFNSSDQYIGQVVDFAMVGGKSARQKQAYEVIRLMMDTPIELVKQPQGYGAETYSPVNVELALQMLDYFDGLDTVLPIMDTCNNMFYILNKQSLTEEEKQQIRDVVTGIEKLSLRGKDSYSSVLDIYYTYENEYIYNDGELNTKRCYFEIMRALNPESEKWNMTPEEIDAFLNEGNEE